MNPYWSLPHFAPEMACLMNGCSQDIAAGSNGRLHERIAVFQLTVKLMLSELPSWSTAVQVWLPGDGCRRNWWMNLVEPI